MLNAVHIRLLDILVVLSNNQPSTWVLFTINNDVRLSDMYLENLDKIFWLVMGRRGATFLFDTHVVIFDIILTVHSEVKYWLAGPDQISTVPIKL